MSQFASSSYDIQRPTGQCAISGRKLEIGESYIATLIEEDEQLIRLDFELDQWEDDKQPENLFCYWKATIPEPEKKKKVFVDDEVLMNLLLRLADEEKAQRIAFRFVLALILMRKKLLRYDGMEKKMGPPLPAMPLPEEEDERVQASEAEANDAEAGEQAASETDDTTAETQEKEETVNEAKSSITETLKDENAAPPEDVEHNWWVMTPKVDIRKGRMGKWDEGKTVEILDPQLTEDQIAIVSKELSQVLNGELE